MPLLSSDYHPPLFFRNGHFSTIYAGVFRKVRAVPQRRERLQLTDGDFLDLDWSKAEKETQKAVLLFHGLEGNAQRHYMTGSAKILAANGYDVCAVNLRSCSGEENALYRSYHSGATEDVKEVLDHVLDKNRYKELFLMGYSLGGNLTLKFLGEDQKLPKEIKGGIGISVPCDLKDSCDQLLGSKNRIYAKRFKKHLLEKLWKKQERFPHKIKKEEVEKIRTLKDFDDSYTAPAHGFKDAYDYYAQCSCKPFLPGIKVPSLIVNAQNDSFLGQGCYPVQEAQENDSLFLEMPKYGGHVGFWGNGEFNYVEERAVSFFNTYSKE